MLVPLRTRTVLLAAALCLFPHAHGCGPFLPVRYLSRGGESILETPEFYFELEIKRLAKNYPCPARAVAPSATVEKEAAEGEGSDFASKLGSRQTADADQRDFAAALAAGALHPPDPGEAEAQHALSREFLNATNPDDARIPPGEFPSEFADYHRGAIAFRRQRFEEARTIWNQLLARPAAERRYRSTWAAYMIGKIDVLQVHPEAREHFALVRQLAAEGFVDTLGLASTSLGWQARFDLDAGAFESAAALYLQQVATGELGAVTSLLTVVNRAVAASPDLKRLANDPTLRQLITAYVLTRTPNDDDPASLPMRWLNLLEFMNLERVEDADRLGWEAYSLGHYDIAKRWLAKAQPASGLALWLKAKLAFRAGKLAEAAAALGEAVPKLPRDEKMEIRSLSPDELTPTDKAIADLGLLRLARSEFVSALRTLLSANHWQDAAFVAERVLTIEELTTFVRREYAGVPETPLKHANGDEQYEFDRTPTSPTEIARQLRWLLARRLVRAERFAEARPYFPPDLRPALDRYATAMKRAAGSAKATRGAALWEAAQTARKDGMELMGSEMEPDAFIWNGQFPEQEVAAEREKGTYLAREPEDDASPSDTPKTPRMKTVPLVLPSSKEERRRIAKTRINPDRRFHYRFVAADLAWKAAELLPDNTEETARVLNTAGLWLMAHDEAAADRFYQAIERRCPKTELGKSAISRRWFVPPAEGSETPVENGAAAN